MADFPELCPKCFPDTDYKTYCPKICFRHTPSVEGSEDAMLSLAPSELQFSGSEESSAETNRAYAKFLAKRKFASTQKGWTTSPSRRSKVKRKVWKHSPHGK